MKISVVVPVYNIDQYLPECIESILNQTYQDFELLLIDDGSTDGSPEICDKFAEKDSRIIVVHQKNSGVAFAREAGMKQASGEYVMFVDGDDWLDLSALEICCDYIKRDSFLDLVMFQYMKEVPKGSFPVTIIEKEEAEKGIEYIYRRLFGLIGDELSHPERLDGLGVCWGKLYRRDVALKGKSFSLKEIGSAEDVLFNIYAMKHCKKIMLIDRHLYHYRKRPESVSDSCRPDLPKLWKRLFAEMNRVIRDNGLGKEYKEALKNRIALSILGIGLNELSNKEHSFPRHIKEIHLYINEKLYHKCAIQIKTEYTPAIWKVLIISARHRWSVLTSLLLYGIKAGVRFKRGRNK